MVTRLYFPASPTYTTITPSYSSSWHGTGSVAGRWQLATATPNNVAATITLNADSTSGTRYQLGGQWIYGPLNNASNIAITGTAYGQFQCKESAAGYNGSVAWTIRVIQPTSPWTATGTALALTAASPTAVPPEMTTSKTNRYLRNTSNSTTPTLTNVTPTTGDYLVIEIGTAEVGTTTTRTGSVYYGCAGTADLPQDDTNTDNTKNPWIEFSTTLPPLQVNNVLQGIVAGQSVAAANLGVNYKIAPKNLLASNVANGCENGTTVGWTNENTGSNSADSSNEYSGSYCLKVTCPTQYDSAYTTQFIPVVTGNSYTLSGRLKNPTAGGTVRVDILWADDSQTTFAESNSFYAHSDTYQFCYVTGTAPANAVYAIIRFVSFNASASEFYLDELQLEFGDSATSWSDPGPRIISAQSTTSGVLTQTSGPTTWPLAGAIAGQSAVSGVLKPTFKLAGSIATQSSAVANLGNRYKVLGVITTQSTTTASLRQRWEITGIIGSASTTSGVLKPTFKLSGAIGTQSTMVGVLKPTLKLSGAISSTSTTTGVLKPTFKLSGVIGTQSSVSANLGNRYKVLGIITGQSTASGVKLVNIITLAGIITTQSTTAGVLKPTFKLSGAIGTQSTVTGVLKSAFKLSGLVTTTSTSAGVLKPTFKLSGLITTQSTTTGVLKPTFKLSGVITSQSAATANVSDNYRVTGIIAGQLATSPTLSVAKAGLYFAGIIQNQSTTTAALKVAWKLTGSLSGQSSTTSNLGVKYRILSTIISQSTLTAQLAARHSLAGLISGQSTTTPLLHVLWKIKSIISGQSAVTATLAVGSAASLAGVINFNSTLIATLTRTEPVIGVVSSLTTTHGLIYLNRNITATSTATSSLTGLIHITWTLGGVTRGTLYLLAGLTGGTYREPDENSKAIWTLRHPPPVMVMGESSGREGITHAHGNVVENMSKGRIE